MKKSKLLLILLSFIGLTAFAQTESTTITGVMSAVSPYNDQYRITVGDTPLVLIVNEQDKARASFEINEQYKDILIKDKDKYELNPKYVNEKFKITYYINGKGWKCIKTIEPVK
jgi:hypothetical protein